MGLQVVGAGVGRTGTHSLKLALERLLGGPCHHMVEVMAHLEQVPVFHDAALGKPVDWHAVFDGYEACVDWPGGAFWPEITEAFPDALVLLSVRESPEAWWKSADRTVLEPMRGATNFPMPGVDGWFAMVNDLFANKFTNRYDDKDALIAAYVAAQRRRAGRCARRPAPRVEARRWLGTHLRTARPRRARRAVPHHQHNRGVPGDARARVVASAT